MLKPPKPYRLRSMRLNDIDRVIAIEEQVFPVPWKASAYQYEVSHNRLANYIVLTVQQGDQPEAVIGYAGLWILSDEAHISTIALDPQWQGMGLGELLLTGLIELAYKQTAVLITLEVRRGNRKAQALYRKYDFELVGVRPRYYQGKEDALLMTVSPLDQFYWIAAKERRRKLLERLAGTKTKNGAHSLHK